MKLSFFNEPFKKQIESYHLTEEQLMYTTHPRECMELSKKD